MLRRAFIADARAHHLAEAVDIEALQAQALLDLLAHFLRPGLGAESAHPEFDLVLGNAHLFHRLRQVKGIGRGAGDAGDAQVADQPRVLLRIAGGSRDHGSADHLHAVMRAQAAGKQAVAVGDGENVVAADPEGGQAAGHALAPHADVLAGVAHDGGVARRAGGSVDADDFALGSSLQAERIVVPQVLLGRVGELHDVLDGADVIRGQVPLLEFVAVEGDVVVHVLHDLVETFSLERGHLVAAHAFFIGIPDHICYVRLFRQWSSWNAFMRSSRTGYSSSRMRLVQPRTPFCMLPVVDREMQLTP